MHKILQLLTMLAIVINTQAATPNAEPTQKPNTVALQTTDFSEQHDLVVEAAGICGAGDYYYVKRGQLNAAELNWLRQLLSYRFNGTTVVGTGKVHIDFEESTGRQVTDKQLVALIASKEFSAWIGADLLQSLSQLGIARAQLLASAKKRPPVPEEFIHSAAFKRYYEVANGFYVGLATKYKLIQRDNLVDCD